MYFAAVFAGEYSTREKTTRLGAVDSQKSPAWFAVTSG